MSAQYSVLDNRPINKWKVAELKEELKRRNLVTKGLKDDLVKRLDEAIRSEKVALEAHGSTSFDSVEVVAGDLCHTMSGVANVDDVDEANIDSDPAEIDEGKDPEEENLYGADAVATVGEQAVPEAIMENTRISVSEVVVTQMAASQEALESDKIEMETEDLKSSQKHTVLDVKPDADTNSTVSEVVVTQIPSSEGVLQDNQIEMGNDVLKSPQNNNFLIGKPELLEASVNASSSVDKVLVKQSVSSGRGSLENNQIEMGNEVLKSQQEKNVLFVQPECLEVSVESSSIVNEAFINQSAFSEKTVEHDRVKVDNVDSKPSQMDTVLVVESAVSETSMETSGNVNDTVMMQDASSEKASEGNDVKPENEGLKPLQMDADCEVSYPKTQVYEVSPNLGFQVKSESISTDTVSIYEKKELKDNLNANSVHLEPELVKPEMVQPSSSEDPSDDGMLYPLDDGMPHRKQGVQESNIDKFKNVEFGKKNVNADNYSVDVSVMEDGSENETSKKVVDKYAKNGSPDGATRRDLFPNKMETSGTGESAIAASAMERKLQDVDYKSADAHFGKSVDVVDREQLEKLNIDQSSGDDSMEEDVLETRNGNFNNNSKKVDEKTELVVPTGKVSGSIDMKPGLLSEKLAPSVANKKDFLPKKRKIQDETTLGNKELPKRQRKWNSESRNVSVSQDSSISTTSNDLLQTTRMKPSLIRSDSTLGGDPPKERVVPPSPKSPTNSLRIDNFLRPFTLKAVQELLAKTGNVCNFWMDHIKTHCFVTYSSVEEAIETRNAVYNLKWPANGGRLLAAEFVSPQEVKARVESGPVAPAVPAKTDPAALPTEPPSLPPSTTRQQGTRQQALPQHAVAQLPPTADRPETREWLPPPPPAPAPQKIEPPIVTLDDLFKKTRAAPRIYFLPLTEEQVSMKLEKQGRRIKN